MARDLFCCVSVKVGSVAFDLSHDLTSFTIEEDSGKPDQLVINISDPYKVFGHALQEGVEIEVDLGRIDDHSVIFRGHIYRVEGDFPKDVVPSLKVIAYDSSVKMGLCKHNRQLTGTLETIINTITEDYSSYFDTNKTAIHLSAVPEFKGNGIRQQEETDLAFLLRLAQTYGCEFYVDPAEQKSVLHFESHSHIMAMDPSVIVSHGRCGAANRLLSFKADADVSNIQLPRVFSGVDFATGERVEQEMQNKEEGAKIEDTAFEENLAAFRKENPLKAVQLDSLINAAEEDSQLQNTLREELGGVQRQATPCFTTAADLGVRAANRFSTSIHGMRASGTTVGNHRIHAQATLKIADVGGRFSGTWYLSKVRHVLDNQGYQTDFECQR